MTVDSDQTGECQLFGLFGMFVQMALAFLCISALVGKYEILFQYEPNYFIFTVKKFLPGENRSWKVFCFDIWKQLLTALFAHFLNLVLAVYLEDLTHEGNGCVWYLVTMLLDTSLGMLFAYILFKIVDEIAIRFGIEVLKSGVYTDKAVPVVPEEEDDYDFDPDDQIQVSTWMI